MSLDPITDVVRRGILGLPPSYWGKPRIASALRALLEQVQELETAAQGVISSRTIDGAFLNQLRVIGNLVGEPDSGLATEDYRLAIKARALANRSRGNVDDLINVFKVFHSGDINWQAIPPAKLRLVTEAIGTLPMQTILGLLRDAKAGGVGLEVQWAPGTGMRFSSSTGGSFGVGAMRSANRDLATMLGQTPNSQLSGFDLPVGPGASWTWTAATGASFNTTDATVGAGWFGLPTARTVQHALSSVGDVHSAHAGQINLPWAVIAAMKIDATQTGADTTRALWSVSTSGSANGYKTLAMVNSTGQARYRHNDDAGTNYQVTGEVYARDTEIVLGQLFDGTSVTVISMDPLTADFTTIIPETAVGASGAFAAPSAARFGSVNRTGSSLFLDAHFRAMAWINSPTFGLAELKDAMRHIALLANSTLPGTGGLFSVSR